MLELEGFEPGYQSFDAADGKLLGFGQTFIPIFNLIHGPLLLDRLVNQNPFRNGRYAA